MHARKEQRCYGQRARCRKRERVLDSLKEEILLCKYNISYPEIGDNCAEHLLYTIESLRQSQSTGAQQEEQG